ncbi:FecR family protein [Chitinophaga sp. YR573]|uniref:FecR family protein n=1 Tax=Chitinophaga sp. YR573 TaxID=1881040 RepID=UPI0008CC11BC|nr:FecR domain-containing protein [Chitinophaga sp. YR573]SEW46127.1 FecR family protein [Chitinophaga sp. YR573]
MDIRKQLDDFAAGKLNAAEKTALRHALAALTEQERMDLFPVDAYINENFQLPEEEIVTALAKIKRNTSKRRVLFTAWKYAAVFLLILGSAFLLRKNTTYKKRSLHVPDGNHASLVLSDGTRVTINGGSELEFPEKFTGAERIVYLKEGEAYFEIAKNPRQPFIVKTSQLNIKVLGTSFSVRDYNNENHASVSVNSGKIELEGRLLTAGYGSVLDKHTRTFTKLDIDTTATTAWIRGEFIFQDATLQQVLQVLQHRYPVHIVVKDPQLLQHRFTATFRNNSIQSIIEQLNLMSNKDNQIIIQ